MQLSDAIGVIRHFGRRVGEGLTDNSGMWGGELKVADLATPTFTVVYPAVTLPGLHALTYAKTVLIICYLIL